MDTSRNQVRLKMIPRIDYTRKRGALKSSEDDADRKRKRWRPPPKLFDADIIRFVHLVDIIITLTSVVSRELGGEIARDGDFQVFESCHFRNGFMYKNFVMAAIVSTYNSKPVGKTACGVFVCMSHKCLSLLLCYVGHAV